MKRSRAFRPAALDRLEARVVLSQTYFSPQTGIIAGSRTVHAEVTRAKPALAITVKQTKLADGQVETTDITSTLGTAVTRTTEVIHKPDGTQETDSETSTTSNGTRTFTNQITLPDGSHQTETGTDITQASAVPVPTWTTSFNHVIVQLGKGTETIVGTKVVQEAKGQETTVTNQTVTHFDGTQDQVKIVDIDHHGMTTTQQTTTRPGGATTTTDCTSKELVHRAT